MRALILAAALAACTSPEEGVVEAGGAAPVRCMRKDSGFNFCRDAKSVLFVCFSESKAACVTIDRVRAVMSGALEVPQ